jgi:superfamily II DNA or RNA helicase
MEEIGIKFGLWVELEMVNKDSDLYRAHPDWMIQAPGRYHCQSRHQHVLDFSRQEVVDHIHDMIAKILSRHRGERTIIFTADNDAAYTIGRRFTLPVLTHHTKAAERKEFLDFFRQGKYPVLVTSKVLNEGVDVPQASVGIIVSGSGSVREHVQRLGRILRTAPGKAQAVLYELISANTSEESISERRRGHDAFS